MRVSRLKRATFSVLLVLFSLASLLSGITFGGVNSQTVTSTETSTVSFFTLSKYSATMTPGILLPMELTQITFNPVIVFGGIGIYPIRIGFTCSGQPDGVYIKFDPNPLVINAPQSSTTVMSATTTYSAPAGQYVLTISVYNLDNPSLKAHAYFNLKIVSPNPNPPSHCLIATAAYGSELAQPVQFLRSFRDEIVLKTFAGSQFIRAFNAWYYSFSPSLANFISSIPIMRAVVRALIYPLIGILHFAAFVYVLFRFNSELGVVFAGFVASALIGVVYVGPPITLILYNPKRRKRFIFRPTHLKVCAIGLILEASAMLLAEVVRSELLMIGTTASFVITSIFSAALAVSALLAEASRWYHGPKKH